MNKADLKKIRVKYMFFRDMLFNNDIPSLSEVDFTLNNLTYAIAYSKHNPKPRKTGNVHEISFSRIYKLSDDEMTGVLIHEMIHLWQDVHVKEERYKICSHFIAHDKVFTTKMNTINMLLAKNMYNIKLSVTADKEYPIDPACEAKTPFTVIFIINSTVISGLKCHVKDTDKFIEKLSSLELQYDKMFTVNTTSYKFIKYKAARFAKKSDSLQLFDASGFYDEFVKDKSVKWIK